LTVSFVIEKFNGLNPFWHGLIVVISVFFKGLDDRHATLICLDDLQLHVDDEVVVIFGPKVASYVKNLLVFVFDHVSF
jgi:hypothetical protein